jgi:nitrate/nitrite transporter NarK
MACAIGASLEPLAVGLSFDHFGSYRTALSVFSEVLLVTIYLSNSLSLPYPYPVRA